MSVHTIIKGADTARKAVWGLYFGALQGQETIDMKRRLWRNSQWGSSTPSPYPTKTKIMGFVFVFKDKLTKDMTKFWKLESTCLSGNQLSRPKKSSKWCQHWRKAEKHPNWHYVTLKLSRSSRSKGRPQSRSTGWKHL